MSSARRHAHDRALARHNYARPSPAEVSPGALRPARYYDIDIDTYRKDHIAMTATAPAAMSFGTVGGDAPQMDEGTYPVTFERAEGPIKSQFPNEETGEYPMQVKLFMRVDDGSGAMLTDYANLPAEGKQLGKKSKLYGICVSFLGREPAEGEQLSPATITGLQAQAVVAIKPNGWPKITQYLKARRKAQAETPQAPNAVPVVPSRPLAPPPPRPVAPAAVRSEEQAITLMNAAVQAEYDEATMTNWIHSNYPGKTIETISPAECDALMAALDNVPF